VGPAESQSQEIENRNERSQSPDKVNDEVHDEDPEEAWLAGMIR
jgi:hypothetical protein